MPKTPSLLTQISDFLNLYTLIFGAIMIVLGIRYFISGLYFEAYLVSIYSIPLIIIGGAMVGSMLEDKVYHRVFYRPAYPTYYSQQGYSHPGESSYHHQAPQTVQQPAGSLSDQQHPPDDHQSIPSQSPSPHHQPSPSLHSQSFPSSPSSPPSLPQPSQSSLPQPSPSSLPQPLPSSLPQSSPNSSILSSPDHEIQPASSPQPNQDHVPSDKAQTQSQTPPPSSEGEHHPSEDIVIDSQHLDAPSPLLQPAEHAEPAIQRSTIAPPPPTQITPDTPNGELSSTQITPDTSDGSIPPTPTISGTSPIPTPSEPTSTTSHPEESNPPIPSPPSGSPDPVAPSSHISSAVPTPPSTSPSYAPPYYSRYGQKQGTSYYPQSYVTYVQYFRETLSIPQIRTLLYVFLVSIVGGSFVLFIGPPIEFLFPIFFIIAFTFPSFIWISYVYHKDVLEPESKHGIFLALTWGMFSTLLAIGPNSLVSLYNFTLAAVIVGPLVEEFFKPLGITRVKSEMNSELDGLIYGVTCGMGFAIIENFSYELEFVFSGDEAIVVWTLGSFIRGVGSTIVHAVGSGLIGFTYARLRIARQNRNMGVGSLRNPLYNLSLPLAYILAVVLHAGWNGSASIQEFIDGDLGAATSIIGHILVFGLSFHIMKSLANEGIRRDVERHRGRQYAVPVEPVG